MNVAEYDNAALSGTIDEALLRTFLGAAYRVESDAGPIELRIGYPAPLPPDWVHRDRTAALITACNPGAIAIDETSNRSRMRDLDAAIADLGLSVRRGLNCARDDAWVEPSRLLTGARLSDIDALAWRFGQLAVLVIGADSIVRMRCYCAPPAHSDVDTRFVDFVPCAAASGSAMNETFDPAETPLLDAREICFERGEERIFGPVSIRVMRGEVHVIEGGNGAGKTSLLRVLAGLLPASEANGDSVRVAGSVSTALLGHSLGLTGELDALENLRFAAGLHGAAGGLGPANALRGVGLEGFENIAVARLSAGQRKRVALARLLVAPASLWLLDEPYANLDPEGIALVNRMIERHTHAGGAVVLTSHGAQLPLRQEATRLRL